MTDRILAALTDQEVQQCYLSTTITSSCVVVRNPNAPAHTIISLERLSEIETIKTTTPGLLVIASGLLTIAAAAFCSKQGDGAGPPVGIAGVGFWVGYLATRRASIRFHVGEETTQTVFGRLSEAAKLRRAVKQASSKAEGAAEGETADKNSQAKPSLLDAISLASPPLSSE
jgi:hypothetical protein